MRQQTVAGSNAVDVNGPIHAVRFLSVSSGALLQVEDGLVYPVVAAFVLPAPKGKPWRKVTVTGPATFQVADRGEEDLSTPVASGAPLLQAADGSSGLEVVPVRQPLVISDSGLVGAGAVINTPVLDCRAYKYLELVAYNGTGVQRNLTWEEYLDAAGTQSMLDYTGLGPFTVAGVPLGSESLILWGPGVAIPSPAVGGMNVPTIWSRPLPPFLKFTLAAGGTTNGRLIAILRP